MDRLKKLTIILLVYAIIMRILWNRLTESVQVNEVLLVLFAVSIIIFTLIFEMHKINESSKEETDENEDR
jgi:hypothetical protein